MLKTAHIALGSNLGSSERILGYAAGTIASLSVDRARFSSLWRTEPEGFTGTVPAFLNAVMAIETRLGPEDLLCALQEIERDQGRSQSATKGYQSRTLDLDLIDYDGRVLESANLVLPHPRACERQFVLIPLQEVTAGYRFPHLSEYSLQELIDRAPDNRMVRLSQLVPLA
ncbi:MAG: 2-amino-4-hydroxy-6-hydroxymethyldihydropteridine diphosphokinase [Proteobacteria bacterium]|nr:2-amino-4-hydroxy-6-hydroxymethyldihydropteridine diphosphokinase [Pseudomonadota bacterium]